MNILIKGIKFDGDCWNCPCIDGEYGDCNPLEKEVNFSGEPLPDCPIIELPDADAFAEEMRSLSSKDDEEVSHAAMDNAMCELLKKLGYEKAVKIFEDAKKWYS